MSESEDANLAAFRAAARHYYEVDYPREFEPGTARQEAVQEAWDDWAALRDTVTPEERKRITGEVIDELHGERWGVGRELDT